MNTKFTPGPWKLCGDDPSEFMAIHSDNGYVVHEFDAPYVGGREEIRESDREEQKANARLMSAAPELLYCLERFVREIKLYGWKELPEPKEDLVREAEEVICKATGQDSYVVQQDDTDAEEEKKSLGQIAYEKYNESFSKIWEGMGMPIPFVNNAFISWGEQGKIAQQSWEDMAKHIQELKP